MTREPAKFIHDTRRIVDVNAAGCALFQCEKTALVDLDMMHLIYNADFVGLARLRMVMLRQLKNMPPFMYKFIRCDGSLFWGTVTTKILGPDSFETTVMYEGEA